METLKKKNLSLPSQVFSRVIATLLIIVGMAACGNKDGGTANTPPPLVGLNGCQNCGAITSPIAITTFNSESMYMTQWPVRMTNMQMFGEATRFQAGSTSSYNLYDGPVAIQGTLEIQAPLYSNNNACVIPAGSYPLQTYSVGSISRGNNLLVPDMVAGGIRLKMIGASYVGGGSMLVNESGAIRWKGTLEIVSFNNINCGGGLWSYMK
jgi:hypothetical protein